MHDPRAASVATKFIHIMNEIQRLGNHGFGVLLDTAGKDEIDDLDISANVLLEAIERTKALLAQGHPKG